MLSNVGLLCQKAYAYVASTQPTKAAIGSGSAEGNRTKYILQDISNS